MAFGLAAFEVFGLLFMPDDNDEGVITELAQKYGGNVHDRGLVTCSASSIGDDDWAAKNATDPSDSCLFCSEDKPDQWICYDFGKLRVNPTGYLLKTAAECGNLREWVVEGSNDGENWAKLSDGRNEKDAAVSQRFSMSSSGFVRMVRLRQTGTNHAGGHELGLSFFDVFGLTAYEIAAAGPPQPLDLEQIQALVPALGANEFADVVRTRFPDLNALQVIELIQKSFPSLNVTQVFEMIRKLFPELNAAQVIELIQKFFPSLNATQIIEMVRQLFPSFNAAQVIELIQKSFPSLNATQMFEMIPRLFPALDAAQVIELIQKSFPSLSAT
jgi:uncharacterized protein (DUF433 family)